MTFADAVVTIVNSSTNDAAKRPAWGGYVKRGTVDAGTGAYAFTYKDRSGSESVYTFNGTTWTAPSTALGIDGGLQEALLADDWIVGKSADFEAARSGSGRW